jgi:hypothetical protein
MLMTASALLPAAAIFISFFISCHRDPTIVGHKGWRVCIAALGVADHGVCSASASSSNVTMVGHMVEPCA